MFDDRYAILNTAQQQAVDVIDGPVLVVAGPGSGKTEILALRVARILEQREVGPHNILCLTFTDAAAANMRERLVGLLGQEAYRINIHTFHSFASLIIERHPAAFYAGASLVAADQLTQLELLSTILRDLPHGDPLGSTHPSQGLTYLREIRTRISELKKAGITPDEFAQITAQTHDALKQINPLLSIFDERVSLKLLPRIREVAHKIRACSTPQPLTTSTSFPSLSDLVATSLERALDTSEEAGKTEALSQWKTRWIKKERMQRVLRDTLVYEKWRSLAHVYNAYQQALRAAGYYDFDDMLVDVLHVLRTNDVVRSELQEQYQYILVDEFQDTNEAQLQIITQLADAPVHEGAPNLMVVGDDDQAIYKFQGAELSNILTFTARYPAAQLITMTDNYRSGQEILDLARRVIVQGTERLEEHVPTLSKILRAASATAPAAEILEVAVATSTDEYARIAQAVQKLHANGDGWGSMAIIARRHRELEALAEHLAAAHIPVVYDRQHNILTEPAVDQLITMARYVSTLLNAPFAGDTYLPTILSYPWWNIPRTVLWEVSVTAYTTRKPWLEILQTHNNEALQTIATTLLTIATAAQHETAEAVLDQLMTETPFRAYYGQIAHEQVRNGAYLNTVQALRTLMRAVREYKQGAVIQIGDVIELVDAYRAHQQPLMSHDVRQHDGVHLMSAHHAKGLEFDTVFILHCEDDVWVGRGRGNKLPFPSNLPLSPAGEMADDQIRLLYVALTRARKRLYLMRHTRTDRGGATLPVRFLVHEQQAKENDDADEEAASTTLETIGTQARDTLVAPPYVRAETLTLLQLVTDYQLNVTHLNAFLNVAEGGPRMFCERHLVRFPEAESVALKYGSAIHGAIEHLYRAAQHEGVVPPYNALEEYFVHELGKARLAAREYDKQLDRGKRALKAWYAHNTPTLRPTDRIEVTFRNEGVVIEGAHLGGAIDRLRQEGRREMVYDLKTGKPKTSWDERNGFVEMQLHQYRRQLVFYKLLVEHSVSFAGTTVTDGFLEFVEPQERTGELITLPLTYEVAEVERTTQLAARVYTMIQALDFPDTSTYPATKEGMIAWEDQLLSS